MRAILFDVHGGPEVLREGEVGMPILGEGEVLVRVKACALNQLDIWARKGVPSVRIPLPHTPGSDIAGIVAETGPGVSGWSTGTEVVVSPGISDGECEECARGRENYCPNYRIIGYQVDGGYAEYIRVPSRNLLSKPRRLSFVEASSLPLVFLTAWRMLVGRARITTGETILIVSAGSGVGSAAIQIAKLFHATVITTVGSDAKIEPARQLGADHVINRRREDVYEATKKFTSGRGVDVVVEHVGTAIWDQVVKTLGRDGRLVTCGATTGPRVSLDLRHIFAKQQSILGSYMGTKGDLVDALAMVEKGLLRPVVDSVFRLEDVADAHRRLESGEHFGKVVLSLE